MIQGSGPGKFRGVSRSFASTFEYFLKFHGVEALGFRVYVWV